MKTIYDLALEILDRFGHLPPPINIVVTAFVDGVYVLENGGVKYILASEQVLDQLKREFTPPDNILGLSTLSGIPVIYDDNLAAVLLARSLNFAAS